MYLSFFGIAEKPFAITPDPRYLYLSARHADALAHLVYGINEAGGFIQLTGEVGTGKAVMADAAASLKHVTLELLDPAWTRRTHILDLVSDEPARVAFPGGSG